MLLCSAFLILSFGITKNATCSTQKRVECVHLHENEMHVLYKTLYITLTQEDKKKNSAIKCIDNYFVVIWSGREKKSMNEIQIWAFAKS